MGGLTPAVNVKLWAAIALVFIVAALGAAPAMVTAPAGASDGHHHVSASGDSDHLAVLDHDHIGAASTFSAPDVFADALLPRLRIALPVLGLIFVVGLLWSLSPQHTALVGRGPPRAALLACSGREVLAGLCISRR
jgi:hypothetical protein